MNKREAKALLKQRLAQIDRAVADRYDEDMSEAAKRALFRERDRQTRLAQEEFDRNVAARASKSTREMRTSRFWRHFGEDGRPAAPWDIEVGPGTDPDEDADDTDFFAEGDYSYEDFDADWGTYEYSDTGYADENA